MFAGHDTTTSTVSFMFYELARNPDDRRAPDRRAGRRAARTAGRTRRPAHLRRAHRARDGARRDAAQVPARLGRPAARDRAVRVRRPHACPARAFVNYCSWASHHLPDVFTEPEEFRPERFAPEARAALPKGAYVPFGGGSRTCIGMRFGQLEVRTIATLILSRFTLSLPDGLRAGHPPDADDQPQGGSADGRARRRAPRGPGRSLGGGLNARLAPPGYERTRRRGRRSAQARPIVSR